MAEELGEMADEIENNVANEIAVEMGNNMLNELVQVPYVYESPEPIVLPDFPKGPLTPYRGLANFDWKIMKLSIYNTEALRYIHEIWDFFKKERLFHPKSYNLTLDEYRHITLQRVKCLKAKGYVAITEMFWLSPELASAWCEAVMSFDVAVGIKSMLTYTLFADTIQGLGSVKHQKYVEASINGEINGCFALYEVANGQNSADTTTTATYDAENQEFILNTPSFEAAKCWIGSLGQCATHMILFANLRRPGKRHRGLYPFIVPVRSMDTLKPFPGVVIGDLGAKIGLNGLDNGFIMFSAYRIPMDCLLDRILIIDDNGNFTKRENSEIMVRKGLSGTRVFFTGIAVNNLQKAITIAIRYSAIRKQLGSSPLQEWSTIEYQHHQTKLLPYIAVTYATKIFYLWLSQRYVEYSRDVFANIIDENEKRDKLAEFFGLSAASKAYASWMARDCIQNCREACGIHGYLQASGFGELRNDNDALCTMEGENNVMLSFTSKWLLNLWTRLSRGERINSPYEVVDFFNEYNEIVAFAPDMNSIFGDIPIHGIKSPH